MKQVTLIDVDEWDELVTNTYGIPYSFQQQDGCKERGIHHFTAPSEYTDDFENDTLECVTDYNGDPDFEDMGVSFESWVNKKVPEQFNDSNIADWEKEMWYHRHWYPNVEMIVNDLHSKGLLTAGDYVIEIDW